MNLCSDKSGLTWSLSGFKELFSLRCTWYHITRPCYIIPLFTWCFNPKQLMIRRYKFRTMEYRLNWSCIPAGWTLKPFSLQDWQPLPQLNSKCTLLVIEGNKLATMNSRKHTKKITKGFAIRWQHCVSETLLIFR